MNIKQLQELYKQYEELARSGEDVVYEIKKNINNGEIEILKDDIIPNIMRQIGRTLSSLRCQLDISLQYDSSSGISYTFCKSDSDIMIENTVPIDEFEKEQNDTSPEIDSEDATIQSNRIRSGITVLRITMPNGKVFEDKKAYKSLIGFIEEVGTDLVASLGIQYNDFPFMTRDTILLPHHDTYDGWHIQTNSSTKQKYDVVAKICRELDIDATVEIINRSQLITNRLHRIIANLSDAPYVEETSSTTQKRTTEDFLGLLRNMKTVVKNGIKGPHKAVFILTIINGITDGSIDGTHIYLNRTLVTAFNKNWALFVKFDSNFHRNLYQPFIHLSSDGFYNLSLKKELDNFNGTWSFESINDYCKYAFLDDDFLECIKDENNRNEIVDFLINEFNLKKSKKYYEFAQERIIEQSAQKPSLAGFKEYLSHYSSNKGKYYSESSQQVYSSCCVSRYINKKVYSIVGTNSLFDITKEKEINTLMSLIDEDIKGGIKNSVPKIAIQLYLDYVKSIFPNYFDQTETIDKDEVGRYIETFQNIDKDRNLQNRDPNKAILLITILKRIGNGAIKNNRIYINDTFITDYNKNWYYYVKRGNTFEKDIANPYFQLTKEDFYHLSLKKYILDIDNTWTFEDISEYSQYAYLDTNLYCIAQNKTLRKKMIYAIIQSYGLHIGLENEFVMNKIVESKPDEIIEKKVDFYDVNIEKYDIEQFPSRYLLKNDKGIGMLIKDNNIVVFAGRGVVDKFHGFIYCIKSDTEELTISLVRQQTKYSYISERVIQCNNTSSLFDKVYRQSMRIEDIRRVNNEYFIIVDNELFDSEGNFIKKH